MKQLTLASLGSFIGKLKEWTVGALHQASCLHNFFHAEFN